MSAATIAPTPSSVSAWENERAELERLTDLSDLHAGLVERYSREARAEQQKGLDLAVKGDDRAYDHWSNSRTHEADVAYSTQVVNWLRPKIAAQEIIIDRCLIALKRKLADVLAARGRELIDEDRVKVRETLGYPTVVDVEHSAGQKLLDLTDAMLIEIVELRKNLKAKEATQ